MGQISNASVQYNDLVGTAALDFHGGPNEDLDGYASDLGIDTDRYYPIGLSFYFGESNNFYLKIMCIDSQIKEVYMEENNGKVPIVIFNKDVTIQSFLDRVKRFEVVFREHSPNFEPHEIYKEFDNDGDERA